MLPVVLSSFALLVSGPPPHKAPRTPEARLHHLGDGVDHDLLPTDSAGYGTLQDSAGYGALQDGNAPSDSPDYSSIAVEAAKVAVSAWGDAWDGHAWEQTLRVEAGLGRMRAAYNSAPDYSGIAAALATAAADSADEAWSQVTWADWAREPSQPRPAASTLRASPQQPEPRGAVLPSAADASTPDYAGIALAAAAAGLTLATVDVTGITQGHGLLRAAQGAVPALLAADIPIWEKAKLATPAYGAIATAAALVGGAAELYGEDEPSPAF